MSAHVLSAAALIVDGLQGGVGLNVAVFVLVVLSSDEEEEEGKKRFDVPQHCSQVVHALVPVGDAGIQGRSLQEAKEEEEASDSEDSEVGLCSF